MKIFNLNQVTREEAQKTLNSRCPLDDLKIDSNESYARFAMIKMLAREGVESHRGATRVWKIDCPVEEELKWSDAQYAGVLECDGETWLVCWVR